MKKILSICIALIMSAAATPSLALEEGDKVHPERMMLLDLTRAGDRLIAVGERGVVIKSDDEGQTLEIVDSPTDRTLTKAAFLNEKVGVAVGHGGYLLRTEDGGDSWQNIEMEETAGDSLLGATALSNGHLIVYGAFGLYFDSADQGKTWERREAVYEGFDWHISQMIEFQPGSLLAVAEAGNLGVSHDFGETWEQLDSPYEGSFFGGLLLPNNDLLVYGMRGNVYLSSDKAETWEKVETNTIDTLNTAFVTEDGKVIIGANNGLMLISDDNGKSFSKKELPIRAPISAVQQAKDGTILYVGVLLSGFLTLN